MPRYMLLLREHAEDWNALDEEEQARLMGLYAEWVASLRAREVYLDGAALSEAVRVIRPDGEVAEASDGDSVPTGYFVFEALDWEEAVETARGCPGLGHGASLELREASEG